MKEVEVEALPASADHSAAVVEAMTAGDLRACLRAAQIQPRQPERVAEAVMQTVQSRPAEAGAYFYALKRRNRDNSVAYIYGPSVRLAELVAYHWGNLRIQTRTLAVVLDPENPHVTVMALAHDMERNLYAGVEVSRRIPLKTEADGRRVVTADMAQLTQAACESIAYREAVLRVVPRFVYQQAYEMCLQKGNAQASVIPGTQTRPDLKTVTDRMFDAFQRDFGLTPERVRALLSLKKGERIEERHLPTLRGYYNGLKSGELTLDELLEESESTSETPKTETTPTPRRGARRRSNAGEAAAPPTTADSGKSLDALMQEYSQHLNTALSLEGATPGDITDYIANAVAPAAGLSEDEVARALTDPTAQVMEAVIRGGAAPMVQWVRENVRLRAREQASQETETAENPQPGN